MKDKDYLLQALAVSKSSRESVPCGCVMVNSYGKTIANEYNSQREDVQTIAHAEIKAISKANKIMGRQLSGVTVYCSCEPCTMCLTALIFAGVKRIVFVYRLNDIVEKGNEINLDCFEFVKRFPYQPAMEQIVVEDPEEIAR